MEAEAIKTESRAGKPAMLVLTSMVFSGALLLFGIEPLVGRLLTPYFGSAAHVWLICLMFFQGMLFIGYLYSHLFARRLGAWHLLLLLLPVISLPLKIDTMPDPSTPVLNLIWVLIVNAALPFGVLSTTAVVAQAWLSDSELGRDRNPYPLYAASNAGSLIALLGYTFIVEPLSGLRTQSLVWTLMYVIYALLVTASWFVLRPGRPACSQTGEIGPGGSCQAIAPSTYLKWLMLSILPSALLLAVTNLLTLEIGSFPLIWIAPLALFLGSFIITFRDKGGVPKYLNILWPEMLLASLALFLSSAVFLLMALGYLALFFALCLVANGTLYELRPDSSRLTSFYLVTALGGWIGGMLVSLAAPFAFPGLYEFPIILVLLAVTLYSCHPGALKVSLKGRAQPAAVGRAVISIALIAAVWMGASANLEDTIIFRHRNFYGTYIIRDAYEGDSFRSGLRKLIHGKTLHGAQHIDPALRMEPVTYYYRGGGISDVYEARPAPRKTAILGLGAGVAAAYAEKGDAVTYYEIDPDNEMIARRWFTFLNECRGDLRVITGDGRLSMMKGEGEGTRYDIIHMDAFTGDGIPTHLLTHEAVAIYLSRLADGGVILFHISNRYYELKPVVLATARAMGLHAAANPDRQEGLKSYQNDTSCVVLAKRANDLKPLLERGWFMLEDAGVKKAEAWTDDYVNILEPLIENARLKLR